MVGKRKQGGEKTVQKLHEKTAKTVFANKTEFVRLQNLFIRKKIKWKYHFKCFLFIKFSPFRLQNTYQTERSKVGLSLQVGGH